jgi:sugar lactone lactonase YvrE
MSDAERILGSQSQCGESPIWDPPSGRLFWIDTEKPVFSSYDPLRGKHRDVKTDWLFQAIGRRKAGGWVAVVRDGFAIWDPAAARSRFLGNPWRHARHGHE